MEGPYTKTNFILRSYIKVRTKEGQESKPNFLEGQETNLLPNIRWYRPKRPITEIVTSNWFPDRYLLISPVVHLFLYSKNISKLTTLLHHGAPTRDLWRCNPIGNPVKPSRRPAKAPPLGAGRRNITGTPNAGAAGIWAEQWPLSCSLIC